ncbi:MAG: hypothetical protein AB8E82_01670 [Aureispira sp.]
MKQFFALITLLLVLANGMAGQTQKTLVKTLALEPTTTSIQVDVPALVEVQEWEENTIRIITTVNANVGENILKALAAAGRYGYTTNTALETGVTTITMPKIGVEVAISGQVLEDQLHVIIYVPRGVDYQIIGIPNPNLIQ